jgi:hypothetical protein
MDFCKAEIKKQQRYFIASFSVCSVAFFMFQGDHGPGMIALAFQPTSIQ